MKSPVIVAVVLFAAFICLASANGCYNKKANTYYKDGESWSENCKKHYCQKREDDVYIVNTLPCPYYRVPEESEGCTFTKLDLTKPYPECCAGRPICPEKH